MIQRESAEKTLLLQRLSLCNSCISRMPQASLRLSAELNTWQQQLQAWALSGALAEAAQSALLLDEEARGELDAWPAIEVLDASAIPGAAGANAASTGTTYLNASWLEIASSEQISSVLSEELGHWLDSWLNGSDTQGNHIYLLRQRQHQRRGRCRSDRWR